jgi:hypothetical protein
VTAAASAATDAIGFPAAALSNACCAATGGIRKDQSVIGLATTVAARPLVSIA